MNFNNFDHTKHQTGLIDGHVHLSEIELSERAVENAVKAGVKRMNAGIVTKNAERFFRL